MSSFPPPFLLFVLTEGQKDWLVPPEPFALTLQPPNNRIGAFYKQFFFVTMVL